VPELKPLSAEDARMLLTCALGGQGIPDPRTALRRSTRASVNSRAKQVDLTLTTEIFAEITQTLVAKTIQPVKKALRDAGLVAGPTSRAWVMVGGATRMPQMQRAVG
jgi:molecular chaperone HscA